MTGIWTSLFLFLFYVLLFLQETLSSSSRSGFIEVPLPQTLSCTTGVRESRETKGRSLRGTQFRLPYGGRLRCPRTTISSLSCRRGPSLVASFHFLPSQPRSDFIDRVHSLSVGFLTGSSCRKCIFYLDSLSVSNHDASLSDEFYSSQIIYILQDFLDIRKTIIL